jgi:hypothetical protein
MAYATVEDVQSRMKRDLSVDEQAICSNLLDDVAVLIDSYNAAASADVKKIVSCNAVIRALGTGDTDIPIGATQGSMSAMGYSQSWTVGSGGSVAELYISKTDKRLLGVGNKIGSYSPLQELVPQEDGE